MAAQHGRRPVAGFHLLIFLLFIGRCVEAQPPSNGSANSSNSNNPNIKANFNPSMAIIVVVLVSAFFLLGFFSIYIRRYSGDRNNSFVIAANNAAAGAVRVRFQRGLDPDVLQNIPTLVYSEVKEHKIGKGALECAICLNEFEDDESIRLLPECDHVFHLECIDAWLGAHVTCPVCRANYTFYSPDCTFRVPAQNDGGIPAPVPPEATVLPDAAPTAHATMTMDDMDERKEELRELARIASKVRGGHGPRRSKRLSKSHSTGHSMMPQGEANLDRYTLRLPENMRKEIIAAGKLQRASTFAVTVTVGGAGEASMRKISRADGEGSSRRGRTIRLGRSDRWPSFFARSLSAKISTLGKRRGGEEGYGKENSISRKLSGIKTSVDSRGGGGGGGAAASSGSKGNGDNYPDEGSTAALNRV